MLQQRSAVIDEPSVEPPSDVVRVRAFPLIHFSDVNRCLLDLPQLAGVKATRLRALRRGVLYMDVEYAHVVPLRVRLRELHEIHPTLVWETDEPTGAG